MVILYIQIVLALFIVALARPEEVFTFSRKHFWKMLLALFGGNLIGNTLAVILVVIVTVVGRFGVGLFLEYTPSTPILLDQGPAFALMLVVPFLVTGAVLDIAICKFEEQELLAKENQHS